MTIKKFRKIKTDNADINRLQDQLQNILDNISNVPIINGNQVGPINFVPNTPVYVNHGLGRNYLNWAQLRPNAAVRIWEIPSTQPDQYVLIQADGYVTSVNFWIW